MAASADQSFGAGDKGIGFIAIWAGPDTGGNCGSNGDTHANGAVKASHHIEKIKDRSNGYECKKGGGNV